MLRFNQEGGSARFPSNYVWCKILLGFPTDFEHTRHQVMFGKIYKTFRTSSQLVTVEVEGASPTMRVGLSRLIIRQKLDYVWNTILGLSADSLLFIKLRKTLIILREWTPQTSKTKNSLLIWSDLIFELNIIWVIK